MSEQNVQNSENQVVQNANWRRNTLLFGAIVGALTGAGAAYMLIQRTNDEDPPSFTPTEGVKLGLMVLGLLRSIGQLND